MSLVKYPLTLVLIVAVLLLLYYMAAVPQQPRLPVPVAAPQLVLAETALEMQAVTAQQAKEVGLTIADSGSFDPKDLCKRYDQAFRAMGIPNACTSVELVHHQGNLGVIQFKRGEDLVASLDFGVDTSENYARFDLPAGKRVWQTALRVYKPYTGRGIGQTIVRNYEIILRQAGAVSGDIQMLVASPDKKVMLPQAAAAWEDVIAQLCIEWNATFIYFPSSPGRVGCWRYLP